MGKRKLKRLTPEERKAIRKRMLAGARASELAVEYGCCTNTVYCVVQGLPRDVSRRGRTPKLSPDQQNFVVRQLLLGARQGALAAQLGVGRHVIVGLRSKVGSMPKRTAIRTRSKLRLSFEEREEISRGIQKGASARAIAQLLRRSASTISREIRRVGGRPKYRAWRGERNFLQNGKRPKQPKLLSTPRLRERVEQGLANYWSPEQISRQLPSDYPDDLTMRVSHETIYQSLFVQGRGALREELTKYLRTRRKARRARGSAGEQRGQIKEMVSIRERPAEAEDRAVPGHWEGDLIIGRGGKSAVATLVERSSRFVMLAPLPHGRTAAHVRDALTAKIKTLPKELRKTLTWDQGKEMAHHVAFTIDTGMKVYFCDPHSPWQRGSNENTNGLLRQFLPKTADLSRVTARELDHIADLMNGRPRQTLGWSKPCDYLRRAVAMTG